MFFLFSQGIFLSFPKRFPSIPHSSHTKNRSEERFLSAVQLFLGLSLIGGSLLRLLSRSLLHAGLLSGSLFLRNLCVLGHNFLIGGIAGLLQLGNALLVGLNGGPGGGDLPWGAFGGR